MQTKYVCFTINNYDETDCTTLSNVVSRGEATYIVFGKETGESGTRHLQGYIELPRKLRLSSVKRILGRRAHVESRLGTSKQAADYCKKDGDFLEFGDISIPAQGRRSDLSKVSEALKLGKRAADICEEFPETFIRYHKGIIAMQNALVKPRCEKPTVFLLTGEPGIGKSRYVHEKESDLYSHPGGQWFDGYHGQEAALFDDFGGSEFKLTYLLKLLDRYQMKVPFKGGYVEWCPKRIYLTSNRLPEEWYSNAAPVHVQALWRRIDEHKTTFD